jgi:UDP-N-acetylmuramyl tripeptide synthase
MNILASFVARWISWGSTVCKLGAGATWPGEIALRLSPDIVSYLLQNITRGIIIVAGTNGKTTTSLMIKKILEDHGYTILHNKSGANLLNGVVSSFFAEPKKTFDYAVFEVDENALPGVLSAFGKKNTTPITLVLLNLFRDQLDRYGEVDVIGEKWEKALHTLPQSTTLIINADDPELALIGKNIPCPAYYFGLENELLYLPKMQHATDTIYCPSCGTKLVFKGVYFSHLGDWKCTNCGFIKPHLQLTEKDIHSPLEGIYNRYNTLAATLTAQQYGIPLKEIARSLESFTPAFGRMEEVIYKGKKFKILLSKNPTGFNESVRTVIHSKKKGPLLMILNDRIHDVTDVSWIYDVDFNQLNTFQYPMTVSGDRGEDLLVCLKYSLDTYRKKVENNLLSLKKQLDEAVETVFQQAKKDETIWILATYSAMLDVRKILTGRKIL